MPAVYSKICTADKTRIFQAYTRGEDYIQLARQIGIKRTTAYQIVRKALDHDGTVAFPRGGLRSVKMSQEMLETVIAIVSDPPDYTLTMINQELRVRLPGAPHVTPSTISNVLKGQLITMKKLEDVPAERNSERTKAQRRDFATWLLQNAQRYNFIYIDEAGINIWTKRTRGRARQGDRAVRIVQGRRGQNLTMTFAVNVLNGLVYHELHQGGMTAERFNQFLLETSLQCNPGQEVCFIFDNARAHGRAAEANLPSQFEIQYLPPYSPFLNICENAFALWKQALKTRLAEVRHDLLDQPFNERMATLAQLAEQETAVVTPNAMAAAFKGMQAYMPRCFDMENILM
ncbi:replication protein a 70 kda DNA-binding subunit [Plakobranchus ocellatus]|uniref:Replication protein a 70 kDa DNA-binding subunit n=1 Tax=Plakobranchus ocellatus TaxID=259542 RepID=A0AAV4DX72_9GAST|nr:replication protein a 70 kda DNA-binding subunit [Plakobranchus ocellatus]